MVARPSSGGAAKNRNVYVALVVAVAIAIALFALTGPWQSSSRECGEPPTPYFGKQANIDFALLKTVAVFKGEVKPSVIDVVPSDARTLQMVGFLSCLASKRGLIATKSDLLEYTQMLGSFVAGKPIVVRHTGLLGQLSKNLLADESSKFALSLDINSVSLQRFWVDETRAVDWPTWAEKLCAAHSCLKCALNPDKTAVSISAGPLALVDRPETRDVYQCAPKS